MTRVKIETLESDPALYPRNGIEAPHVLTLVDAIKAGASLPPIVADRATKKIVDGFHRHAAYKRLEIATVDVLWRDYKDEGAIFAASVQLNAEHGLKLDALDRRRAVIRLAEFGYAPGQIAKIAMVPIERIQEIKLAIAVAPSGERVVVKRALSKLLDLNLTRETEALNKSWGGQSPAFYVNQLIQFLESGARLPDGSFCERMERLVSLWAARGKKKAS